MGSSSPSRAKVYDEFRKVWVAATPEEIVRQKLLQKMVGPLCYPRGLISVERLLSDLCPMAVGIPYRRVDIVCFAKVREKLVPLLVIECKEKAADEKEALAQVQGYNHFLQAYFIAVAHPEGEVFGYKSASGFSFLSHLPSYPDLTKAVLYG